MGPLGARVAAGRFRQRAVSASTATAIRAASAAATAGAAVAATTTAAWAAAISAAATATAGATVSATAPTTAGTTRSTAPTRACLFVRFVHDECPTFQGMAVQGCDGGARSFG